MDAFILCDARRGHDLICPNRGSLTSGQYVSATSASSRADILLWCGVD